MLWDESSPGWSPAAGWPITLYPAYSGFLLYGAYLLEGDDSLKNTCLSQAATCIDAAIELWGEGMLISGHGAHAMSNGVPLYWYRA